MTIFFSLGSIGQSGQFLAQFDLSLDGFHWDMGAGSSFLLRDLDINFDSSSLLQLPNVHLCHSRRWLAPRLNRSWMVGGYNVVEIFQF